jgi:hypothetical protein
LCYILVFPSLLSKLTTTTIPYVYLGLCQRWKSLENPLNRRDETESVSPETQHGGDNSPCVNSESTVYLCSEFFQKHSDLLSSNRYTKGTHHHIGGRRVSYRRPHCAYLCWVRVATGGHGKLAVPQVYICYVPTQLHGTCRGLLPWYALPPTVRSLCLRPVHTHLACREIPLLPFSDGHGKAYLPLVLISFSVVHNSATNCL